MPMLGYKTKMPHIVGLKNVEFIINFKLNYSDHGSFENRTVENHYFDVGDFHIKVDEMADDLTPEILRKYDNGIYLLSVCKFIVDKIPELYSIKVSDKNMEEEYLKDEIIDAYNNCEKYQEVEPIHYINQ